MQRSIGAALAVWCVPLTAAISLWAPPPAAPPAAVAVAAKAQPVNGTIKVTCKDEASCAKLLCAENGFSDLQLKCEEQVNRDYNEFVGKFNETHSYLVSGSKVVDAETKSRNAQAALESAARFIDHELCKKACGLHVDSRCETECGVEMYWCVEYRGEGRKDRSPGEAACIQRVQMKFRKFEAEWNTKYPYLASQKALFGTKPSLEEAIESSVMLAANGLCKGSCHDVAMALGTCIEACQAEMYHCLDLMWHVGPKEREDCEHTTAEKYHNFKLTINVLSGKKLSFLEK